MKYTLEHKLCDASPGSEIPDEIWSIVFAFDATDEKDADHKAFGWARYHSFDARDVRVRPATDQEVKYRMHNEWAK